jgi:hypothetical protein
MQSMELIQLWGYRCQRCGHEWVPKNKVQKPRVCPKCKNPYWDRPRRGEAKEGDRSVSEPAEARHDEGARGSEETREG